MFRLASTGMAESLLHPAIDRSQVVAAVAVEAVALEADRAGETEPLQGPQHDAHVVGAAVEGLNQAVPLRPLDAGIGTIEGHREQQRARASRSAGIFASSPVARAWQRLKVTPKLGRSTSRATVTASMKCSVQSPMCG